MPIRVSKLVSYSCILMVSLLQPAFAEEPKLDSASHLAHGRFQQAIFNQDETELLTATNELVQLWDLKTGALIQQFEGHRAKIQCVCFSSDGQSILTSAGKDVVHGPEDPTVRLWDVSSGKQMAVLSSLDKDFADQIETSCAYIVRQASFSPDGKKSWQCSIQPHPILMLLCCGRCQTKKLISPCHLLVRLLDLT